MREISDAPTLENVAGTYRTLRELVSRSLRAAILSGAALPGQMLREQDVARRLGVSKTPVREAFRELEREGLVESAPHRGVVVVGLPAEIRREMLELRVALEPFAARLAAERAPSEDLAAIRELAEDIEARSAHDTEERFHRKLYELCGNARIARLLLDALEYSGAAAAEPGGHDEHRMVAEAIARRDPIAAETHMRAHVCRMLARVGPDTA